MSDEKTRQIIEKLCSIKLDLDLHNIIYALCFNEPHIMRTNTHKIMSIEPLSTIYNVYTTDYVFDCLKNMFCKDMGYWTYIKSCELEEGIDVHREHYSLLRVTLYIPSAMPKEQVMTIKFVNKEALKKSIQRDRLHDANSKERIERIMRE